MMLQTLNQIILTILNIFKINKVKKMFYEDLFFGIIKICQKDTVENHLKIPVLLKSLN